MYMAQQVREALSSLYGLCHYVGTMMIVLTYDVSGFRLILDNDDALDRLLGIINIGTYLV
jgi:hypothetical protein